MEYCCWYWAGASSYYLEMLDKRQKKICRTAFLSLIAFLNSLVHSQNVASLGLYVKCLSDLALLVPFPYSWGMSTWHCDRLHDISATIPWCYMDVCVSSFFPFLARLFPCLLVECSLLTYDLNGFMSRINKYLLSLVFF